MIPFLVSIVLVSFSVRNLWIAVSIALVWTLGVPLAASPAGTVPPGPRDEGVEPGERLDVLVERIRFENARRHSLEASFVQLKDSALLLEPLRAEGEFSYEAPDKARWEYHLPDPISLVIDGDEMLSWYRDLGLAERYQIGRHSEKVLDYLGASSSIGALLEYFTVYMHMPENASEPYKLRLVPRYQRIAKRIKELEVWIEAERYLPLRMRYTEADGDITEYRFSEFSINREIPDSRFELDLPADVEIEDRQLGQRRTGG